MGNTTIMVKEETREELKNFGMKNETYDDIINKLIKTTDKRIFFSEQKRILETEKFTNIDDL